MSLAEKNYNLPDIISEDNVIEDKSPLHKVGMSSIDLPIFVENKEGGKFFTKACIDAFVSLDNKRSKGIHMSRLYLILQEHLGKNVLNFANTKEILTSFIKSHSELSKSAYLEISYSHPLLKKSLISNNKNWHFYATTYLCSFVEGVFKNQIKFTLTYSSTCPCSATLARQKIQQHFKSSFAACDPQNLIKAGDVYTWLGKEENIVATPHSQRSYADIILTIKDKDTDKFCLDQIIGKLETSLQTAVQGVVKREDEQEFAVKNAKNLMFAEDAVRRIKTCLEQEKNFSFFSAKVSHQESLHPHNAVAYTEKYT